MEGSDIRQRKVPAAEPVADEDTGSSDESELADVEDETLSPDELQMRAGWAILCRVFLVVSIVIPIMLILLIVLATQPAAEPVKYRFKDPPALKGALKENNHLTKAERLYENELVGPESIVFRDGYLYTGTHDGKVLRISQDNGQIEIVVRLGVVPEKAPCGMYATEPICGRPLGMKFDNQGFLIVVDAYLGVFKVNVSTKKVEMYFPASMVIEEDPSRFLNDIAITSDGILYITDSSQFERREFVYDILEGTNTGRLLKHDPRTNETEVLVSNLGFGNGLQLSKDEDYLLISETAALRIGKFHLSGPKKGQWEEFIDNLPGMPDNIRASSSGGYWIAMGFCRYEGKFDVLGYLMDKLTLRMYISKLPVSIINMAFRPCSMLLEVNKKGQVVRSLMDLSGEVIQWPSEVEDVDGTLYIGSYRSPYIGKISASVAPKYKKKVKSKDETVTM